MMPAGSARPGRGTTDADPGDVALAVSYRHEAIEHMAAVLLRENRLQALYVRHDFGRLLSLAQRLLPPDHRVVTTLARRSFSPPGTPVAWSVSPKAMLASRRRAFRFADVDQLGVRLDAAVARRLRARPPRLFIGMPYTSLLSLRAARTAGTRTCLYVNTLPWARNDALTQEAQSLTTETMRREALDACFHAAKVRRFDEELMLADRVIAQSTFALRTLVSRGVSPEKIALLPNGVDTGRFRPIPRDARTRRLRVLYVGRVEYRKGLRFLGEAVARVPDAVESLVVVGGDRDGVSALCATMPYARFVGEVPTGGVIQYHARADVLVLPSLADSMPRVVLEGMASGLPVIITPLCGYEGIVENGVEGFLVPPRDPQAIAERLRRLSADGELRVRMGRAARARAEEHTWPRFEARFLDVLRRSWLT